ncbi:PREDICTED: uncharacterized protein LOC109170884 [Ipomoea nil]|uniref:uncharacterized protein LOC109170884 n=1 Tax=Ipomoea nil TaxID=35883 RepID=UPI0009009FF3|nr:PREDICTED: uncharacterized protein LOC109170884 [Ipomoea nil]
MAESLEHVRHFAGLPSESAPKPYKVIRPRHVPAIPTNIRDLKAVTRGVTVPPADHNESLLVAETAHPDSTTFKIREVTKLLASCTVHGSETGNYVSPSPTKSSPVRETRKSKTKGVPEKVTVGTSDEPTESTQPEKKRRSVESEKAESDPPIRKVFKNLRLSVKGKAPAVVPSTKGRKIKVVTKPRGRSVTPDVQNAPFEPPGSPDTSVYKPRFVSDVAQDKWHTMTVTSVCAYSKLLTYEFYCNLNEEIDDLTSKRCTQIFIRGNWYVFGPDVINQYYGLKTVDKDEITDWDPVAKTLTGRVASEWPTVSKPLAALLFRVGTKMTVDIGKWIFSHFPTLIHPKEQKVKLPYPNLIFGVLTSQLNVARTELATDLLRMSLSESAAGEALKSDSGGPSNA